MRLPVIALDEVWHVGTMKAAHRGKHYPSSYEGSGLSVSVCPDAWVRIAQLGGNPLRRVETPGALFLDFMALGEEGLAAVREWAVGEGLLERREAWRAWRYDDEDDRWSYMTFLSEDEALDELDQEDEGEVDVEHPEEEGGPPGGLLLEPVVIHALTAEGDRRATGYGRKDEATDIAAMFWLEDVVAPQVRGMTGIWWREDYDPDVLSAPRGAILPSLVPGLKSRKVPWERAPDEEELLDGMPETSWVDVEAAPAPRGP